MSTTTTDAQAEARLRQRAKAQGYRLRKWRGGMRGYGLVDPSTNEAIVGLWDEAYTLADIEEALEEDMSEPAPGLESVRY